MVISLGLRKGLEKDIENSPQDRKKRERFATINIPDNDDSKTMKEMKRLKRNVHKRNVKFTVLSFF